ncbi:hypothetical protein FIM02_00120 [SAR202 cluster bacterium AD-802-E10_MRT_200m]|nr:hypothetical protein [SAR202 cluster bacterium AD-802-E10_MRT_200m]
MASKWFAENVFKGRIGEAIVECLLTEFGYKVERVGHEQSNLGNPESMPDLKVTHPANGQQWLLEVKYRSARPDKFEVRPNELWKYRKNHPGTLLAFASPWDGSIYCAKVEEVPLSKSDGGLSLTAEYWKPIWHFFPLVKEGEQLKKLWKDFQHIMATYGTRQISDRNNETLWDGEYEALDSYLEDPWDPELEQLGILKPNLEQMTLEKRWELVREIAASGLAVDLLGVADDDVISDKVLHVMQRVLDRKGEQHLRINLGHMCEAHGIEPTQKHRMIQAGFLQALMFGPFSDAERRKLISGMKEGIHVAYLLDPAIPFEQTEAIDLKTALLLLSTPCRLDRDTSKLD